MPHRHYIPGYEPPTFWDRVLAHPYVIVFSGMAIILGLWIIGGAIFDYRVSANLEGGPAWARISAASPAVLGGVITIQGLIRAKDEDKLKSMVLECLGVLVMAVSWGCYAILLVSSDLAGPPPPWGIISFFMAIAHGMHGWGLILTMRRINREAKEIQRKRREGD